MNSSTNQAIVEADLVKKKVGNHMMFLDKTDTGISRVLIKKFRRRRWLREPEFMDIIHSEVNEGMIAFDIGANIGYITLLLAERVGSSGHIYAVEPSPRNFEILNRNIKLNHYAERVSLYQIAISNMNGTSKFYISKSSNLQSLAPSRHTVQSVDVAVQTGDYFFKDKPFPNFIKMDIEGVEVEAIEGMIETLKRANQPIKILIETHPMYYSTEHSLESQLRKLIDIGFYVKHVISAGSAKPNFFAERGYEPQKVYFSGMWSRGVYSGVSNEDVIVAACHSHEQLIKRPLRSCLKRPWLFFNRTIKSNKLVRGLFLEK